MVVEVLLEEVQARYKAEHERYSQLYGRIGVFSAVFALYANVLVRFSEKPPPSSAWYVIWYASALALALFTVVGFILLLAALWGKAMAYSLRPSQWLERAEPMREYASASLVSEGKAQPSQDEVEERTVLEMKQDLLKTLAEATDINIQRNAERFASLHWASRFAAFGFIALLVSLATYVGMGWGVPAAPTQVTARIVAPIELAPGTQVGARIVEPIRLAPPQREGEPALPPTKPERLKEPDPQ